MIKIKTANDLMSAMTQPHPTICIRGHIGLLQGVQREDGSGKSFNVQLLFPATNKKKNVYISFNETGTVNELLKN